SIYSFVLYGSFHLFPPSVCSFFLQHPPTTDIYTLSLHDALPISPFYPAGTIFVVVIDPGVGTARKALVVKSKRGQYFVLPDNGLLTLVEDRDGIEGAREIRNPSWMIGTALSSTFHGRDIFCRVVS